MTNELGHAMYINMCSLYMLPDNMQKKKPKKPQNIKHPQNQNNGNKKPTKRFPIWNLKIMNESL